MSDFFIAGIDAVRAHQLAVRTHGEQVDTVWSQGNSFGVVVMGFATLVD